MPFPLPRLSVEEAVNLYLETGATPIQSAYSHTSHGFCPMGLHAYQHSGASRFIKAFADAHFGEDYVRGYVRGFDDLIEVLGTPRYQQGYADGRAAREAIIENHAVEIARIEREAEKEIEAEVEAEDFQQQKHLATL